MKKTLQFALFAAVLGLASQSALADAPDCGKVAAAVKTSIAADPAKVLEIIETQVAANEACACEIVKAAIVASEADKDLVAQIVEVVSTAAPEKMRLAGQCAVAVAPDALVGVQAVLAKLDPGAGEAGYSAKGAKEAAPIQEVAAIPNPLDFPGTGPVGPTPGGPGGNPILPPGVTPFTPPIVTPPATDAEFSVVID